MDSVNIIGNPNRATNLADRPVWKSFLFKVAADDATSHQLLRQGIQSILSKKVNVTVRAVFFECLSIAILNGLSSEEMAATKESLERAFLARLNDETEKKELRQLAEGILQRMVEIRTL